MAEAGASRRPQAQRPTAVGLLGGGVIGGGWAARFLLNGVDVKLYDPAPGAERRVQEMLENARRAYRRLTLVPLRPEGRLIHVDSPQAAAQEVALVQESAPERLELKRELLAAASAAAAPEVLFCSSTSGLRPTLLAGEMTGPERLLVAHPFNPVYLLPLVELVGGERTDAGALERAAGILRSIGMHPLRVRHEIDGFISDRLLEALWREALWLVHDDVATVEEVDDAIRFGPGLRWAFMGTFLIYRIAGGEQGMHHFMRQFGPALQAPWSKLTDVPELTDELLEKIAAQSDEQAQGRAVGELERERDDVLVALLQALRAQETGAGASLAEWERGLLDGAGPEASPPPPPDSAPLELLSREVPPDWVDYNGHVHESRYLQLFADATDALLRRIGIDADYVAASGSYYTVETHLSHLGQAFAGDRVTVTTQVLGADDKRLHVFHVLSHDGPDAQAPIATAEQMLLHVSLAGGRAAPAGAAVLARVSQLTRAHSNLPRPERAGRHITPP